MAEYTGYAAPTMATDGVRVYAIFASGNLVAADFQGNQQWRKSLGIPKESYGHASSLATYKDLVIVQLDQGTEEDDLSKLLALRAPRAMWPGKCRGRYLAVGRRPWWLSMAAARW